MTAHKSKLVTSHTEEEAMRSVVVLHLAAALLLGLNCAPILAAEMPAPGIGAAAAPNLIAVNTVDDQTSTDGKCSLREAISAANLDAPVDACPAGLGDDMIILPEGRYLLRLAGAGEDDNATGDLDLRSNVTLIGAGSGLTIIDGGGIDRVLDVHVGAYFVVNGVTITKGATPNGKDDPVAGGGNADPGGGIRNAGALWLLYCMVMDNRAGDGGRGQWGDGGSPGGNGGNGGGIANFDTLISEHSSITSNLSGDGGSGGWTSTPAIKPLAGNGGGIYNAGSLTLNWSTVARNMTGAGGSSVVLPYFFHMTGGDGGGLWSSGIVTGTYSLVQSNQAGSGGKGGSGGGIWNGGRLTFTYGTLKGNQAGESFAGGPGGSGGGIFNAGDAVLSHCTIGGNLAGLGSEGAKYWPASQGGDGGGILNSGDMHLSNCTVSGNRAGDGRSGGMWPGGGAGGHGGGIMNENALRIEYSTVTANTTGIPGGASAGEGAGGDGGGIINQGSGAVAIKGLLLAGNTAERNGPDCLGTLTSQGYNLIQDAGYCTLVGELTGNIISQAAWLAPLADNGGATWTHALLSSSPAIDRADCRNLAGALITTDQRGWPRPMGVACDIGAYEKVPNWYLPLIQR